MLDSYRSMLGPQEAVEAGNGLFCGTAGGNRCRKRVVAGTGELILLQVNGKRRK